MRKKLNIGLFGFGCVGSGLYEVLNKSKLLNAGISKIVVKDKTKERTLPTEFFSYDKDVILKDSEINLVVELINDAEAAWDIVSTALKSGKHVVSANKKLIAERLPELLELSKANNVSFLYEAAVCGSIPVIRNLEEYYNNDSISSIEGICNGTSNYILTKLTKEGRPFAEILADAQKAGFAEIDPTLDIDGWDSKYKLQILLLHAFGLVTKPEDILNIGIRNIKANDIRTGLEKGYRIKLIAGARRSGNRVAAYVAPKFVKADNFAWDVSDEFNAVSIEGLFADKQLFKGKGAGSYPTASAVLSDISALQYDYRYEYRKSGNGAVLEGDFKIRVYISSSDRRLLNLLDFDSVEEEFRTSEFSYRVGTIRFSQLNHELYRSYPELFIAFLGEVGDLKSDGLPEIKEKELKAQL
jgi:homoserine dehydrogenase